MLPTNHVSRYLLNSWAQTCGIGWSLGQILLAHGTAVALTITVLVAAYVNDLDWSWVQYTVAGLLAWDLLLGVIGYSHSAIKRRRDQESSSLPIWHHNLQHIHPLILIYFDQPALLLGITTYWFLSFLLYIEFLEVVPATGQRRLSVSAQKWVVGFEILASLVLVGMSFVVDVTSNSQVYGISVYVGLVIATSVLIQSPASFQRTVAVISLVTMTVAGLLLSPPAGFEWLVPIYFLKLLVGFTAKDETRKEDIPLLGLGNTVRYRCLAVTKRQYL